MLNFSDLDEVWLRIVPVEMDSDLTQVVLGATFKGEHFEVYCMIPKEGWELTYALEQTSGGLRKDIGRYKRWLEKDDSIKPDQV